MWGVIDTGELSVSVVSGTDSKVLWRFAEDIGNQWNMEQATIQIPDTYDSFRVVFQARPGRIADALLGDSFNPAIDDVMLEEGACPSFGSCTFEDGYCIWYNVDDSRNDFNWELRTGGTASSNTGPSVDHTMGTAEGQFLFMEASYPSRRGEKALLESSVFLPTPSYGLCFEFWYHMYGENMGTLNIYVNSSSINTLVWTQSGDKGEFRI